jgi:hypothetical protein
MPISYLLATLDKTCVNTVGVVLATTGACMLWYFVGDVLQVNKDEILDGKDVTLTIPQNNPEFQRRLRIHIWLARLGVFLTVSGGMLQVTSNYLP